MLKTEIAQDAARRFARERLQDRRPDLICAQWHGDEGVAGLCAIEAAIAALWASPPAQELVWLTRTAAPDRLHLQAFADGRLLQTATYELGDAHV
jgi:hypothetical protein